MTFVLELCHDRHDTALGGTTLPTAADLFIILLNMIYTNFLSSLQHDLCINMLKISKIVYFLQVGSKYYHQICGISQGSVLSTLLCSLYYANMERDYLEIGKDDLLMRIVDDYLYVTPSKKSATRFLNQMLNGKIFVCLYWCFTP